MIPKCPAFQKRNSSCSTKLNLSDVTKNASFFFFFENASFFCPHLFIVPYPYLISPEQQHEGYFFVVGSSFFKLLYKAGLVRFNYYLQGTFKISKQHANSLNLISLYFRRVNHAHFPH